MVETSSDSPERSLDVLELGQFSDLGDIAGLSLTLVETRHLLSRVRQAVIAAQAQDHPVRRPSRSS